MLVANTDMSSSCPGSHRRCCDICHAEEETGDPLVQCEYWHDAGACARCSSELRAHIDCLEKWHQALQRSSSSAQSALASDSSHRSRSASNISETAVRRPSAASSNTRLLRRSPVRAVDEKAQRSRSATTSPSGAPSPVAVGTTASCGDLQRLARLEDVFEPRLAPYTPPLRLRSAGLSSSSDSFQGAHRRASLSEDEIEVLERMIFEPRDAMCTPPLRRRPPSSAGGDSCGRERDDEADLASPMSVVQLQEAIVLRRSEAKSQSTRLINELRKSSEASQPFASQLTVRQLARLSMGSVSVPTPQNGLPNPQANVSSHVSCR